MFVGVERGQLRRQTPGILTCTSTGPHASSTSSPPCSCCPTPWMISLLKSSFNIRCAPQSASSFEPLCRPDGGDEQWRRTWLCAPLVPHTRPCPLPPRCSSPHGPAASVNARPGTSQRAPPQMGRGASARAASTVPAYPVLLLLLAALQATAVSRCARGGPDACAGRCWRRHHGSIPTLTPPSFGPPPTALPTMLIPPTM